MDKFEHVFVHTSTTIKTAKRAVNKIKNNAETLKKSFLKIQKWICLPWRRLFLGISTRPPKASLHLAGSKDTRHIYQHTNHTQNFQDNI